jgi:arylsulfatase A-like enzyme
MSEGTPSARRSSAVAMLTSLICGFCLSCGAPNEPAPPPNVLLILADTLRADYLGSYGSNHETSPNLDRFARENLIFRRAVSPAPWTSPAVASLFTSLYPTAHKVAGDPVNGWVPPDSIALGLTTVAEQFSSAGYATSAIVANPWVAETRGYAQGFDQFRFPKKPPHLKPPGAVDTDALGKLAAEAMLQLFKGEKPFFFYLHLLDPHDPYSAPAELVDRFHPDGAKRAKKPIGPQVQTQMLADYRAEIFVVDRALGVLFDVLRAEGMYEELIIAFVSDHGEQFYERGELGHGHRLFSEETHVPFLLKAPGLSGEIDSVVSTLDVGPTLLDVAGLPPIPGAQGVSLTTQLAVREERGAFTEATMRRNFKALVAQDGRKLVIEFDGKATDALDENAERDVVGLFDWSDGNQRTEDPAVDEARTRELRALLYRQLADSVALRSDAVDAPVELDAATVEALKALGYVGEPEDAEPAGKGTP